jgi:hypothetical protein
MVEPRGTGRFSPGEREKLPIAFLFAASRAANRCGAAQARVMLWFDGDAISHEVLRDGSPGGGDRLGVRNDAKP